MTDSLSDDTRLRATEEQMRRALGLDNSSPTHTTPLFAATSPGASSPQRRRFVRDGEVPVSVIRRDQDDGANTSKLDTTRQALREQAEARERAEHMLQEAQATIRDLQTKMAHERLARDEAIQRAASEMQVVEQALQRAQDELAIERDLRQQAEQKRDQAIAARQEAEERLRAVEAIHDAQKASQAPPRSTHDQQTIRRPWKTMPTTEPPVNGDKVQQQRRRGRPAKSEQSDAEIVEWWKPGWQKRSQ